MANNHMKRCSTSLVSVQMQIKAIVRHHYILVSIERKKNDDTSTGKFSPHTLLGGMQNVTPL